MGASAEIGAHIFSVMQPGVFHAVLTVNAAITHGEHFFNPWLMRQTLDAVLLSSKNPTATNDCRDADFMHLLVRTLQAWMLIMRDNAMGKSRPALPEELKVPDLKDQHDVRNFVSLVILVVFADQLYPMHREGPQAMPKVEFEKAISGLQIFLAWWNRTGAHLLDVPLMFNCFEAGIAEFLPRLAAASTKKPSDYTAKLKSLVEHARKVMGPSFLPELTIPQPIWPPRDKQFLGTYIT